MILRRVKNEKKNTKLCRNHQSVRSVAGKLSQKDSIEALYQTRDPLIQKLVFRDLSKLAEILLQDYQGGNEMVLYTPKVCDAIGSKM